MKSDGITIQMKPLQQYFHLVLSILLVVRTFCSMGEILWHAVLCSCSINFIILNLALLTYEAGGKSCAVPFD